ncbi:DUF4974 domain-containing protein [Sphingobacterium sp. DK4209]|uniref:DUF4974 domain-containing protein n=1 Tax=Sphingobacterium zhuxiongii TaxID=2662364 RepID=A0A5Q0QB83_9SPHI|nr:MULTISPECIES: FecR family protein [unclassified Sphingobacterium]MVZ65443.1 DUF4974 domain-containing protein [Sphingobacterium sp. DK4209]QGA27407.1 DUF4974 domain-containing protein [Sphingobacterium sp. dk4302]
MYNLDEIVLLLQKRIDGSISKEETSILDAWAAGNPHSQQILDKIDEDGQLWDDLVQKIELDQSDESSWDSRLQEQTRQKIRSDNSLSNPTKTLRFPWFKVACSFLLICTLSYLFFHYQNEKSNSNIEIVSEIPNPSSRAILRLDNGKIIELNAEKSGLRMGDDLSYVDGSAISDAKGIGTVQMLSLEVPKGGTYQLVLSDGTKVWLNSGSKLRYPLKFKSEERHVELVGEGYFEVQAKKHLTAGAETPVRTPFSIKTKNQVIEVLGTAFNVEAYEDDAHEKTSLLHGKVRVLYGNKRANSMDLSPGEQSTTQMGAVVKSTFNPEDILGWKDDMFVFNNTDLNQALKVLSRWYDFDVFYEGDIPQSQFFAEMKRSNKLSTVLKTLEKGGVKFRMEKQNNRFRLVVKK